MDGEVIIYGLHDPRDGKLRYVGQTSVCPTSRLRKHISTAKRSQTHCAYWIRQLLSNDLRPDMKIIEQVKMERRAERERYWIAYYRSLGCDLTNLTDGGEGMNGFKHTEETKRQLALMVKGKKRDPRWYEGHRGRIPHNKIGEINCSGCGRRTLTHARLLCPACYQASRRPDRVRGGQGIVNKMKTHCTHGHLYNIETTGIDNVGYRYCLECYRVRRECRNEKRRALKSGRIA
jgi:hypothetical protein